MGNACSCGGGGGAAADAPIGIAIGTDSELSTPAAAAAAVAPPPCVSRQIADGLALTRVRGTRPSRPLEQQARAHARAHDAAALAHLRTIFSV